MSHLFFKSVSQTAQHLKAPQTSKSSHATFIFPPLVTLIPVSAKVKDTSSTYNIGPTHPQRPILPETFSQFLFSPFKLPRFQQLPTVYIIALRRVIWLFPGEMKLLVCFWSPEPPPLCSSVTAPAYSQSQMGGEKMKKKKKILVSGDATERLLKGTAQK